MLLRERACRRCRDMESMSRDKERGRGRVLGDNVSDLLRGEIVLARAVAGGEEIFYEL